MAKPLPVPCSVFEPSVYTWVGRNSWFFACLSWIHVRLVHSYSWMRSNSVPSSGLFPSFMSDHFFMWPLIVWGIFGDARETRSWAASAFSTALTWSGVLSYLCFLYDWKKTMICSRCYIMNRPLHSSASSAGLLFPRISVLQRSLDFPCQKIAISVYVMFCTKRLYKMHIGISNFQLKFISIWVRLRTCFSLLSKYKVKLCSSRKLILTLL